MKFKIAFLSPERRISLNDYNLFMVRYFLTIILGICLHLAMMVDPLHALLGYIGYSPSSGT